MNTRNLSLAALLGLALASTAAAQDPPGPRGPGGRQLPPEVRERMLKEFDTDGDGKLSEQERANAKETVKTLMEKRKQAMLDKVDKDGDGQVSEEEKAAAKDALKAKAEARRKAMLEKYDADGDGTLDEAERKTMLETERKALVEKFDKDGDGKLSPEERKAAVQSGEMPPPPLRRPGAPARPGGPGPR
jgi:Ca2+-binding EF-hand superfamily protein